MVVAVRPQKTLVQVKRKPGRPRICAPRHCKRCGKEIFTRPSLVRKGHAIFCQTCYNLLFRPPKIIRGKMRVKAGGLICPHCKAFRQTYKDDQDICCLSCGKIILTLPAPRNRGFLQSFL